MRSPAGSGYDGGGVVLPVTPRLVEDDAPFFRGDFCTRYTEELPTLVDGVRATAITEAVLDSARRRDWAEVAPS